MKEALAEDGMNFLGCMYVPQRFRHLTECASATNGAPVAPLKSAVTPILHPLISAKAMPPHKSMHFVLYNCTAYSHVRLLGVFTPQQPIRKRLRT